MSASVSAMPGGQPSTTQPIAGPWLSPKVVTRKRWPKVLCDMGWDYSDLALRSRTQGFGMALAGLFRTPGRSPKLAAFGTQIGPLDRFDRAATLSLSAAGR